MFHFLLNIFKISIEVIGGTASAVMLQFKWHSTKPFEFGRRMQILNPKISYQNRFRASYLALWTSAKEQLST